MSRYRCKSLVNSDAFVVKSVNCRINLSNTVGSVEYSRGFRTPFYAAISSVFCAPVAIFLSFSGAALANRFSYKMIFGFALAIYAAAFLTSLRVKKAKAE